MSDPSSPKVAQPTEHMTAEQFRLHYGKSWRHNPGADWLMEAFAEHCTAALIADNESLADDLADAASCQRAETRRANSLTIKLAESRATLESSAALVRELAQWIAKYGDHGVVTGQGACPAFDGDCNCGLEALLSRDDVKKALEEKEAKKESSPE